MTPRRAHTSDPATDRVSVMQAVRGLTVVALLVIPAITRKFDDVLVPITGSYALLVGIAELARRRARGLDHVLMSWMFALDGLVVTVAMSQTGGYRSPLMFLLFVQVTAATLLGTYRTGLKLASWCAVLLLVGHAAADADIVQPAPTVSDRFAVVSAATFLLFAFGVAAFSRVNERSLRHSRSQLGRLVELSAELQRARRAEDVMSVFVRHVCGRLGFERAVVLASGDDRWWGVRDDGVVESLVEARRPGAAPPIDALHSASPLLVRNLEDGLLDAVLPNAQNVVIAPLVHDDDTYGLVAAEWGGRERARIPVLTVQALAQAASHTASALHNAALLTEVERLATRDSLTGIANRRLFDESVIRESARAHRLATPLSLVVFDVDHFKQINDTYGHLTGDGVLREVAGAIVSSTKSFDVAARYGGDEFMLLLPGCSATDAVGVTERVRAEIAHRVAAAPVTVSAGVATMPDNAIDAERLVSAADAALYEAKRNGRDQAIASTREGGAVLPTVVRLSARGA